MKGVEYEWDESKRITNLRDHEVDFAEARAFNWDTAQSEPDRRYDYNEERFISTGLIGWRVYRMAYTYRGEKVRIISLRKAEKHEVKRYVRQI